MWKSKVGLVFKDDYVPLRLPIYSENYLRDFIFSGGKDPYLNVIEVEQTSAYTPDDAREYNKPKVVVVKLTDNDYVGREIRTSVSYKTLENWYSESNAVKSVIESECFAYVEDKLCVATSECLERNRTISNMKKGENLTKSNVISACLGIHIPFILSVQPARKQRNGWTVTRLNIRNVILLRRIQHMKN